MSGSDGRPAPRVTESLHRGTVGSESMNKDDNDATTRTKLIRGAIKVIASHGLRGLTLRAAASEAGLTHGMVRHHFGTRDNLIEAAMQYAIQNSLVGAMPAANGGAEPLLGDHVVEVALDTEGTFAFEREILNEALRRPELRPLAAQMYAQYEGAVGHQLATLGVTRTDAVVLVAAAMDGLARRQMDLGDIAATERAVALMHHLIRLAVAQRPAD